eukprot:scaffold264790_cov17-Tisochrysis_lutea.AAC.1
MQVEMTPPARRVPHPEVKVGWWQACHCSPFPYLFSHAGDRPPDHCFVAHTTVGFTAFTNPIQFCRQARSG